MPSDNTNILNLVGSVADPTQMAQADGATTAFLLGRNGDALVSEIHGRGWLANYRGKLFEAAAVAVTIPVITASLASVFTLYNPPTSGAKAEIFSAAVFNVVATTVVDIVGWYSSPAISTAAGTFTTVGTVHGGIVQGPTANQVSFYSSYTHSGTPTLTDMIGCFGAVSNAGTSGVFKQYNGELMLPPGIAMSIAMSTAAGGATGLGAEVKWIEWPL
jgi:hypothetical protein